MSAMSRNTRNKLRKEDDEDLIDPVYHALSKINGSVNKMTKNQLKRQLELVGLNNRGVAEVLRKRLKNYYKKQKLSSHANFVGQCYPYLVAIDYEATCEAIVPADYLHEIIEFPAILIDTKTCAIVDKFHAFCKPTLNPDLSEFCTSLTGITQQQVDDALDFTEVFSNFEKWLRKHELLSARKCAFVTDGSWDFSRFLNIQCCLSEIKYPSWARKWINLKKIYGNFYKLKKPRLPDMLESMGLPLEGRLHCGLDDATNIARIIIRLIEDGAMFQVNEKLASGRLQNIPEKERILMTGIEEQIESLKDLSICCEDSKS